jgi:hypothetical protein
MTTGAVRASTRKVLDELFPTGWKIAFIRHPIPHELATNCFDGDYVFGGRLKMYDNFKWDTQLEAGWYANKKDAKIGAILAAFEMAGKKLPKYLEQYEFVRINSEIR